MENIISRYRNATILAAVLFLQIIGLAIQVKRPTDARNPKAPGDRLIRIWAVELVTPVEKAVVGTSHFFGDTWRNYLYLRGVRAENRELKAQIEEMRLEQARNAQDASQARRLQALLGFKEQYVNQTVAAQVIGTSGSEQSRIVYIDKGSGDGLKRDMPVITPDGIVGKVKEVFPGSSQVLLINDQLSGAGAILEKSRLQGTVKGTSAGGLILDHIMSDEKVEVGERVLSSGGDQIFPKGFPLGTVTEVAPGQDVFLTVRLKPAADLNRLEEVLVITKIEDRTPEVTAGEPNPRAADVLAERLPTYRPPADPNAAASGGKPANAARPTPLGPGTKPSANPPAAGGAAKPTTAVPDKKPGDAPKPKPVTPPAPDSQQGGTPR